jgi:hypothetical protein
MSTNKALEILGLYGGAESDLMMWWHIIGGE